MRPVPSETLIPLVFSPEDTASMVSNSLTFFALLFLDQMMDVDGTANCVHRQNQRRLKAHRRPGLVFGLSLAHRFLQIL